MYNPVNLADMVKGMKNKTMTREQKIAQREAYDNEIALVIAEGNSQMH